MIPDRTADTFRRLITTHVAPGSTVHTDGHASYEALPWQRMNMTHAQHVHNQRGRLRRTMAHSNLIEGLWGQMKDSMKRIYVSLPSDENLDDFLFESMFRRELNSIQDRAAKQDYITRLYMQF